MDRLDRLGVAVHVRTAVEEIVPDGMVFRTKWRIQPAPRRRQRRRGRHIGTQQRAIREARRRHDQHH